MSSLSFKSRVGLVPVFFAPRTTEEAPDATLSGPTGEHELVVAETDPVEEFGQRWRVELPEPFWLEGDYTISVAGLNYEIEVGPHAKRVTPDEAKRLAALPKADYLAAVEAFVPEED